MSRHTSCPFRRTLTFSLISFRTFPHKLTRAYNQRYNGLNLKFEVTLQRNTAFENGAQMDHWFATINPLTPGRAVTVCAAN
jgi:hypothetical protein